MAKSKQDKKISKAVLIIGGIVLTAVGFMTIPTLLSRCSNWLYKKSIKIGDDVIDNMGPEIVKK